MIKDLGVVREPRGISWQNGLASCKDVMTGRRKYVVLAVLALLAAVGSIYIQHRAATNYAHRTHHARPSGTQLNVRSQNSAAQPLQTIAPPSASASTPSGLVNSAANIAAPLKKAATCDYTAMAKAELSHTTATASENAWHTTQLSLLQTTGTLTSLLGTDTQNRIDAENSRHAAALRSIDEQLTTALSVADCR